ncbi:MAG TPA: GNAT family N-acetyltransferase, partial [Thiohalobacter sp.]|nr:GNAT family N-acetyltransferase [Thiohalobacter sp.]
MTDDAASATGFLIARADWETDTSAIRAIRNAVFVDEQGIDAELEFDGADPLCVHYLAYDMNGRPIATARMAADGRIGRMAVLPDCRNQGVGSALLLSLIELAGEHQLDEVYVHAQESAAG